LNSNGHIIARNTLFTFITQISVGIIAIVSIPFLVRRLGEETFGMLTVVWMVVGYFSILDLGVGQASVKFLAGQMAKGDLEDANSTFWGSLGISVLLGSFLSIVFVVLFPLVKKLMNIPIMLESQLNAALIWIAFAILLIMTQSTLRAIPTALQRFDSINIIQGLSGLFQWSGALIIVYMGGGFIEIILLTVCVRIFSTIAICFVDLKLFPSLSFPNTKGVAKVILPLVKYGAWINVSQILSPVVKYLDRVMVASYLPLRIFTYYVIPYETLSRLQIIPMSISTSLFPALAEKEGFEIDNFEGIKVLYVRSLNFILLTMLPITILLFVFSKDILNFWLGANFPILSNSVFKLLTLATCIQAIGYIPLTTLQAAGKPEIAAKYYILEIPLYIFLCFVLIPTWGIEGAAWAFLIRLTIIVTALLWTTQMKIPGLQPASIINGVWRSIFLNLALLIVLILLSIAINSIVQNGILVGIALIGYAIGGWFYCIENRERKIITYLFIRDKNK
jgi:O-antigen/teichoic acid export membrane protein